MQRQPRYFKDDKEVTAQQALRGNVLQNGYSVRVPAFFKDTRQHFSDARSYWDHNKAALLVTDSRGIGGSEGNKPGFRIADSPINRRAVHDAHAAYVRDLQSAWRNDAAPDEEDDDGDRPHKRRVWQEPDEDDDDDDDDADQAAESQSDAIARRRRRRPEPDDDSDPPFGSQDRRRTADEMQVRRERILKPIYDSWVTELANAWRGNK